MSNAYDPTLLARAARIRLACFDVDGTLTDGRLFYDAEGRESKAFHVLDGLGMKLLEENGVAVAFITARRNAAIQARARDLGLLLLKTTHAGTHAFGARFGRLCVRSKTANDAIGLEAQLLVDRPDFEAAARLPLDEGDEAATARENQK